MSKLFKILAVLLALAAIVCTGVTAWNMHEKYTQEQAVVNDLKSQIAHLTKREKESAVMQSVNAQLEEIANQQRIVSDERREEAVEQTKIANEMRQHAEQERQNAQIAERRALEASEVAKKEQIIAEKERLQAEYSKRVADTLSYIALSRTLANTAVTQYQTGNHELADLLEYAVCLYTNRYHGDLSHPVIYQALALTSQNKTVWNKHKGSVTDIAFGDEKQGFFVTCSSYGEVIRHTIMGNRLNSTILISNPQYDFRDVFINRKTNAIYALSRTGELLIFREKAIKNIKINVAKMKSMDTAGDQFILFGEKGMALFDTEKEIIVSDKQLPFVIEFATRFQNFPVIFDRQGRMHIVKGFNKLETKKVPFEGQVTAFAESKNSHSSSYDGVFNMWMTNMSKIEPMSFFNTKGWILNFTFDLQKNYIWAGDQNGNIIRALISLPMMQQQLRAKIKRNLTREEWNYYIGKNIPYEPFIGKEARL